MTIGAPDFHRLEYGLDFLEVKVRDLAAVGALKWDGKDAPGPLQMLGTFSAQIAEEAMDGAQANIASANSIMVSGFETLQKRGNAFDGEIFDSEPKMPVQSSDRPSAKPRRSRNQLFTAPHIILAPGIAITLAVLAFNLLGDGLRDALDPRLNR